MTWRQVEGVQEELWEREEGRFLLEPFLLGQRQGAQLFYPERGAEELPESHCEQMQVRHAA
ncbi:MAG: hypothetical protein GX256_06135 [Fretibacterium sp.]|nr:hypothetical protein [Fretibacterium sp.]